MVADSHLIPDDPKEQESVQDVLREHPELEEFITRTTSKAQEMFDAVRVELDTVRYDEWDPPMRFILHLTQPWEEFKVTSGAFIHWFAYQPDYEPNHILVMPMWDGPAETFTE